MASSEPRRRPRPPANPERKRSSGLEGRAERVKRFLGSRRLQRNETVGSQPSTPTCDETTLTTGWRRLFRRGSDLRRQLCGRGCRWQHIVARCSECFVDNWALDRRIHLQPSASSSLSGIQSPVNTTVPVEPAAVGQHDLLGASPPTISAMPAPVITGTRRTVVRA